MTTPTTPLPHIPAALVQAVREAFPLIPTRPHDEPATLFYRGGQQSVIEWLAQQAARQQTRSEAHSVPISPQDPRPAGAGAPSTAASVSFRR